MSAPYQLLPPLTPAEYAELRADIEANGIEQAVIVDDLGHIIDGHHRAQIADELGIECPVDVRVIDSEDAKRDLALRLNVHRRSLTRDQKRELLANLIKAAPERSDRQHASAVGVDHKTAGAVRSDLEGRGEIPHAGERTDTLGRQQPAKVTHRTTESETVEYTSPGSRAPLQDSAPGVEQLSEPGALDQWLDDDDNLRRARFNKLFYADIARATRITANTAEELAELGDDDALSEYESLINNLERHCQRAKALRGSHLEIVR